MREVRRDRLPDRKALQIGEQAIGEHVVIAASMLGQRHRRAIGLYELFRVFFARPQGRPPYREGMEARRRAPRSRRAARADAPSFDRFDAAALMLRYWWIGVGLWAAASLWVADVIVTSR